MSSPSDNNRSGRRVTLPPIRDLFRDEFLRSPPSDPPSTTLAQLRMNDSESEAQFTRSQSTASAADPSSRMYRQPSGHASALLPSSTSNREHLPPDTPRYPSTYQPGEQSSNSSSYPSPSFSRLTDASPSRRPSNSPAFHSYPASQPFDQSQYWPPSNQHPYPTHAPPSSHPDTTELTSHNIVQMPGLPTSPNPAASAQVHDLDSPPALVQAVAPWVIATNLDVGQIYEDDERTPIARPFDGASLARSTSHPIPLGRFLDDGSQPPLGKYDCKFCGKLFNRPSSLRIHLNSHTGEKPFVCPHADCGRSFSVLSNMRRHARVHMGNSKEQEPEESNDESSNPPSPAAPLTPGPSTITQEAALVQSYPDSQSHCRQDSNTSVSSSSSRRSRGRSSGIYQAEEVERPEKRTRHHPD